MAQRRWAPVTRATLESSLRTRFLEMTPPQRRDAFLELAWPHLQANAVSWAGFYLERPGAPADQRLLLEACRGGPACSPIGLHGACGQAFTARSPLVIEDVATLGEGYIACDPRDRSELVVPLFEGNRVLGVLDLDSHEIGAFGQPDLTALQPLLEALGLSEGPARD